jgi:predicted DNA-binding transcriptional regulator AlpA
MVAVLPIGSNKEMPPSLADLDDLRMLSVAQVCKMCWGISPRTLYRWYMKGTFPKPIKYSPTVNVWVFREVEAWIKKVMERPRVGEEEMEEAANDCKE